MQGDRFQLNVIDQMTNHTMLKSTSIVSITLKIFVYRC